MSAFLLGTGFRADMGTCIRKLVLLKLIDACEDDGSRIFPAIATVARAAQCSERQVQREIRAFLDIGLLALVREGGKGRRSTNEYALDLDVLAAISRAGWDAYVSGQGDQAKGDRESPLEDAGKGDTEGTDRVTPATAKGDSWSHTTPPDSSTDPSVEREARASGEEGQEDDPKKFEARVKRLADRLDWPGWANSSTAWAVRQFALLSAAERAEAERRGEAYMRHCGRKALSIGVYFAERKWVDLPDDVLNPPVATVVEAKPFGPLWNACAVRELLSDPAPAPAPSSAFLREMLERQDELGAAERLKRQAAWGWPKVNAWYRQAESRRGFTAPAEDEALAALMEPVPVGSERFGDWKREYERRGWPWIPDPGGQRVVYFPKGGPDALGEFAAAVNGEATVRTTSEAAE